MSDSNDHFPVDAAPNDEVAVVLNVPLPGAQPGQIGFPAIPGIFVQQSPTVLYIRTTKQTAFGPAGRISIPKGLVIAVNVVGGVSLVPPGTRLAT